MPQRPLRTLAAWGYESAASGTRIEIDVWTVNPEDATEDALERAKRAFADDGRITVLDAVGNVARVSYAGAAPDGYRYIDMSKTNPGKEKPSDATQQAFAGAVRSAGGSRDKRGRQTEGFTSPDSAPGIDEVRAYGENEIVPVVRREMREIGMKVDREPSRDEEDEPVTDETPFSGFKNVLRVFPHGAGDPYRYEVRGNSLTRLSKGESPTTSGGREVTR